MPDAQTVPAVPPERERFASEVDYAAPKPGRCLAYVSFSDRDGIWMLRVIEGPSREDLLLRGIVTDFDRMQIVSFHVSSPLLDALADNPVTLAEPFRTLSVDFNLLGEHEGAESNVPRRAGTRRDDVEPPTEPKDTATGVKIAWATPGSERHLGPDAALVSLWSYSDYVPREVSFTAVRRGWDPLSTIALVAVVIAGGGGIAKMILNEGRDLKMGGKIKVGPAEFSGQVEAGPGLPRRDREARGTERDTERGRSERKR